MPVKIRLLSGPNPNGGGDEERRRKQKAKEDGVSRIDRVKDWMEKGRVNGGNANGNANGTAPSTSRMTLVEGDSDNGHQSGITPSSDDSNQSGEFWEATWDDNDSLAHSSQVHDFRSLHDAWQRDNWKLADQRHEARAREEEEELSLRLREWMQTVMDSPDDGPVRFPFETPSTLSIRSGSTNNTATPTRNGDNPYSSLSMEHYLSSQQVDDLRRAQSTPTTPSSISAPSPSPSSLTSPSAIAKRAKLRRRRTGERSPTPDFPPQLELDRHTSLMRNPSGAHFFKSLKTSPGGSLLDSDDPLLDEFVVIEADDLPPRFEKVGGLKVERSGSHPATSLANNYENAAFSKLSARDQVSSSDDGTGHSKVFDSHPKFKPTKKLRKQLPTAIIRTTRQTLRYAPTPPRPFDTIDDESPIDEGPGETSIPSNAPVPTEQNGAANLSISGTLPDSPEKNLPPGYANRPANPNPNPRQPTIRFDDTKTATAKNVSDAQTLSDVSTLTSTSAPSRVKENGDDDDFFAPTARTSSSSDQQRPTLRRRDGSSIDESDGFFKAKRKSDSSNSVTSSDDFPHDPQYGSGASWPMPPGTIPSVQRYQYGMPLTTVHDEAEESSVGEEEEEDDNATQTGDRPEDHYPTYGLPPGARRVDGEPSSSFTPTHSRTPSGDKAAVLHKPAYRRSD